MTCGLCSTRVSIPEKAIIFYLRKIFDDIIENYRPDFLEGKEIDIYLPKLKLGIEYDGERWHSDVLANIEKSENCRKNGIRLIRIREPECPSIAGSIITPKAIMNGNHMTEPIRELLNIIKRDYGIKATTDVDCRRDNADICRTLVGGMESNSLARLFPEIAIEWDYDKNYPLTPDKIAARAGRKVWWICPNGHSYSSVVASRTGEKRKKCGCSICANRGGGLYVDEKYVGEPSLQKERPDIAAEFMEDKNLNLSESENKEEDIIMEEPNEVEKDEKDMSEDSKAEDKEDKAEEEKEMGCGEKEMSEDSEIEEEDKDEDKEEEKKFSLDAYVDQSAILAMLENETEERRNLVNQVVKEFSAEEILKKIIEMSKENELLKSEKEFNDNEKKEKKFSAIMASVKEDLDEKTFSELSNEGKELALDQLGAFENKVKAFAYEATKNKKDNIVKQDNIMMFGGQDSIEQDSMDVFERISKK